MMMHLNELLDFRFILKDFQSYGYFVSFSSSIFNMSYLQVFSLLTNNSVWEIPLEETSFMGQNCNNLRLVRHLFASQSNPIKKPEAFNFVHLLKNETLAHFGAFPLLCFSSSKK